MENGQMENDLLKRIRELEDENAKLRRANSNLKKRCDEWKHLACKFKKVVKLNKLDRAFSLSVPPATATGDGGRAFARPAILGDKEAMRKYIIESLPKYPSQPIKVKYESPYKQAIENMRNLLKMQKRM